MLWTVALLHHETQLEGGLGFFECFKKALPLARGVGLWSTSVLSIWTVIVFSLVSP